MILNCKLRQDRSGYLKGRCKVLVLCDSIHDPQIRALVPSRQVMMRQESNYLCGQTVIDGHLIWVSGDYGSCGLPRMVPHSVWEKATPLPKELSDLLSTSMGHNSAGSAGDAIKAWALANIKSITLRSQDKLPQDAPDS